MGWTKALRFYHEPPAGSAGDDVFRVTRLSVLVMLLVGGIGSIFAKPLAAAFGLGANGAGLVPFLFLNAALYMLVRYLDVVSGWKTMCAPTPPKRCGCRPA